MKTPIDEILATVDQLVAQVRTLASAYHAAVVAGGANIQERDEWKRRALDAEAKVGRVVKERDALLRSDADDERAVKVAEEKAGLSGQAPEPVPTPKRRTRRPDLRGSPTVTEPPSGAAARDADRRAALSASKAVACPVCQVRAGVGCVDDGLRKGPFHAERWQLGRSLLARYQKGLTVSCATCGALAGHPCMLRDGRDGMHEGRGGFVGPQGGG